MPQPEGKIQLAILKYLQSHSVYCWRNANLTPQRNGRYLYNPQHKSGLGDIICVIKGIHTEIEVKTKTGRQSHVQRIHQQRLEDEGGVYILARSVEDVEKKLELK